VAAGGLFGFASASRSGEWSEDDEPHRLIVAAAEAANQVSYAEGNGGGRVWALLYGCAEEVLSPAGAFANSFHGIRRRLLHLSVDILHCTFPPVLPCPGADFLRRP
jgi:hypothetical protein